MAEAPWRVARFGERLDEWIELESPDEDVRLALCAFWVDHSSRLVVCESFGSLSYPT